MHNLQEIIGFLLKIQLHLNLYANNDRAITQNTPKCVEKNDKYMRINVNNNLFLT